MVVAAREVSILETMKEEYQSARLRLESEFRKLFADLYLLGQTIEINRTHLELLRELEEVVTERYVHSLAPYQDLTRIQIEIEENGLVPSEAIIAAAQQRFRPILLTTFTTTLGLIPLYLGGGLMWEPMAVSIMVGLLFATVITLLFVPVLYKVLFRVKG